MTTAQALFQDILDHPEDDTPRLVLADWWDEYGDDSLRARADFLRIQVELARLPAGDARRQELHSREAQLSLQHGPRWLADLPTLEGVEWAREFVRGFVERARVATAGAFRRHAEAMFAAIPLVSLGIRFTQPGERWDLIDLPFLERLRELDLGFNGLAPEGVQLLVDSPRLVRLTSLLLHSNRLGDRGVEILAGARHLSAVTELYLSGNEIGDLGCARLAGSARFPSLKLLDLRDNHIRDSGLAVLAESLHLSGLEHLWIINNRIGELGGNLFGLLRKEGPFPHLRSLWLSHNLVRNRGALALAGSPARTVLRDLDLRNCEIGDQGGLALADSPYLAGIESLRLSGNPMQRSTVETLRARFGKRVVV
jgi:uncharacterized protein (TIGR02996 family)